METNYRMLVYIQTTQIYKPVVYGMCKSALEYLNKQASIHLAKEEEDAIY